MRRWREAFEEHFSSVHPSAVSAISANSSRNGTNGTNGTGVDKAETALGGVPTVWVAGVTRLQAMDPPVGYSTKRWAVLVSDGQRFLEGWGERAALLGWNTYELFAVHHSRPADRYDAMGLVPCLNGDPVVELTERDATTESPRGAQLTFARWPRLKQHQDRVPVWELADEQSS